MKETKVHTKWHVSKVYSSFSFESSFQHQIILFLQTNHCM